MLWNYTGNHPKVDLEQRTAFLSILRGAIRSGGVDLEEANEFVDSAVSRMKLFEGSASSDIDKIKTKIKELEEEYGQQVLLSIAADNLSKEMTQTVFAIVVDIVLSDGILEPAEERFLDDLEDRLRIKGSIAKRIVEVMMIKNRG